jgi:hypothetical protein
MSAKQEVYFEFQRVGNFVKVTAIDPVTLTEVSVTGAATATQAQLKQLALRRLQFVLAKKKGPDQGGGHGGRGTVA